MNEDTYIGRHKDCGGRVISWYQSGHYYHHSGVFCEKCKKENIPEGEVKPLRKLNSVLPKGTDDRG